MRSSKLLISGVLALALTWAGPVQSADPEAPADDVTAGASEPVEAPPENLPIDAVSTEGADLVAEVEATAETAESETDPTAAAASEAGTAGEATALEPAGEASADAPAEAVTHAEPTGEAAVGEAGTEPVADAEAPPSEFGEPVADAEAPPSELGMVGYDSQGRPGRIHLVVSRDTLWDISDAYLGTPWVWPSIWQDNQDIANPHLIHPGDRIWITPSEMRRITPEEAEALLAGTPAALGDPPEPVPTAEPAPPVVVELEARTQHMTGRDAIGLITSETLDAAGSIVDAIPDRVMLSEGDRVYIGVGDGSVAEGDGFTIFRVQEKVVDPDTGKKLGYHVNILGWLEVKEVSPETSLAVVKKSTGEIERGDRVMPREPMVAEIPVQASPDGVEGKISFFADMRTVMGTVDFVYLNRGTLDGIEVGSPLEVYRDGFLAEETVRSERVRVPEHVIAQMVVVKVEPGTAAAFVTHTETELAVGDQFRGATR